MPLLHGATHGNHARQNSRSVYNTAARLQALSNALPEQHTRLVPSAPHSRCAVAAMHELFENTPFLMQYVV